MRYALTAAQIRKAEALATASGKVTMAELMQRAGSALAAAVMGRVLSGTVAVVCGKGNNGGDGWVAARILFESGRDVRVVSLVDPATLTGLAAEVASAAIAEGVAWEHLEERSQILERLERVAVTVDAVFGVGFSGAPRGVFALAIEAIEAASTPVVSADVPSGVDADTGRAPGPAVHADVTVTFSAHKIGLVQYPGAAYAGEVVVADVGLDLGPMVEAGACEVWEQDDYARVMPLLEPDAHKGARGRVLLVAGSRQYAGAAVLAAAGAMRMGAGYAIAAVPECVVPAVQASLPHVIAVGLPQTSNGSLAREAEVRIRELASEADAVVIGPGLTTFAETSALVRDLVETLTAPLLIDADGINALGAADIDALHARAGVAVLTPHPGELAHLVGCTVAEIQADRIQSAVRIAGERVACVLKGARTVVATRSRTAVTLAGNAGMATAGTGDVLAGMCGTLLAQGLHPFEAAVLATHVHGRAGDLAAADLTEVCLTSSDLVDYIPGAMRELLGAGRRR